MKPGHLNQTFMSLASTWLMFSGVISSPRCFLVARQLGKTPSQPTLTYLSLALTLKTRRFSPQDIDALHSYFQPKTSGRSEGRPTTPGSSGRGSMVGTPRAVFTDSVARMGLEMGWGLGLGKWIVGMVGLEANHMN